VQLAKTQENMYIYTGTFVREAEGSKAKSRQKWEDFPGRVTELT